jgi:hypothetical protein
MISKRVSFDVGQASTTQSLAYNAYNYSINSRRDHGEACRSSNHDLRNYDVIRVSWRM